jgi:hypothetical protein
MYALYVRSGLDIYAPLEKGAPPPPPACSLFGRGGLGRAKEMVCRGGAVGGHVGLNDSVLRTENPCTLRPGNLFLLNYAVVEFFFFFLLLLLRYSFSR